MSSHDTEKQLRTTRFAFHGIAGATLLVMLSLGWWALIQPIEARQYSLLQRTGQLETTLAGSKSIHAQHASLCERLAAAQKQESSLQARIPDDPSEEAFLALASRLAAESGLTIKDYRPGQSIQTPSCSAVEVELIGEGDYVSLCRFLDGVSKLPRLSSVSSLHVDTSKAGAAYRVEISVLLYFGVTADSARPAKGVPNA